MVCGLWYAEKKKGRPSRVALFFGVCELSSSYWPRGFEVLVALPPVL